VTCPASLDSLARALQFAILAGVVLTLAVMAWRRA
jgi:hypothetical protein